jgi:DNA-binding response OmpR family regulator
MGKVVVCEDDPLVRASISTLCDEAGLEVVAETDSGGDAAEMVRRFGVDVLVVDLSLKDGSGERTIEEVKAGGSDTEIVVFTAYAADAANLLRLGAREVVEKPDFERLGAVLARIGAVDRSQPAAERRIASRPVAEVPPMWRSPSGVSCHHDVIHSLRGLEAGDAVIAVTLVGLDGLPVEAGSMVLADCRLAVARALRQELRVQDLLHEAPEVDGFLAFLRGGDARAAGALWSRVTMALREAGAPGEVRGAATRVDASGAGDAVARTIAALQSAGVGSASFVSV